MQLCKMCQKECMSLPRSKDQMLPVLQVPKFSGVPKPKQLVMTAQIEVFYHMSLVIVYLYISYVFSPSYLESVAKWI